MNIKFKVQKNLPRRLVPRMEIELNLFDVDTFGFYVDKRYWIGLVLLGIEFRLTWKEPRITTWWDEK